MKIRKLTKKFLFLIVISSGLSIGYFNISAKVTGQSSGNDVTNKLEILGQPFNYQYDVNAQNVWDMQAYDGKIYLGYGDYDVNTGPTPIIYYDPSASSFVSNTSAQDEEINSYKVLNGQLYIPGLDPIEWDKGDFYRMEDGTWERYNTLPNIIHTFDMAYYNNKIYAATGAHDGNNYPPQIFESSDNGETWKDIIGSDLNFKGTDRIYTLFEFNNKLYGVSVLSPQSDSELNNMICIHNGSVSDIKVRGDLLLSGVNVTKYQDRFTIFKPHVINNKLLYIVTSEDIGNDSKGLFVTSDLSSAKKIELPEKEAAPIDILVRGNSTYVLAYVKTADKSYTNIVYKSNDLDNWIEQFRFKEETCARSFEELNGDFYFGLGWEGPPNKESTGKILRLKANSNTILPQPGDFGDISLSDITNGSVNLSWKAAASQNTLQYKVVYSTQNNIDSVNAAESNGTVAQDWTTNLTSKKITDLKENTRYYFNVLVKDSENNKNIYTTASNVFSVYYGTTNATGGTPVQDKNCYTIGEQVTVEGDSNSLIRPGYTLAGWNTKEDGTGTNYEFGSTLNMNEDDVYLYPQWKAVN